MINILLVEDDNTCALLTAMALDKSDYGEFKVKRVRTIEECKTEMAKGGFDCYLIDNSLGDGLTGIELLNELHGHAPGPFIMLTASEDPLLFLSAIQGGAVDFVNKRELQAKKALLAQRIICAIANFKRFEK